MDKFFSYIPGMSSRVGNHIDFPNYEIDELVDIAKVMVRDLEYEMDFEAEAKFREYIAKRMTMPFFSNARTVSFVKPGCRADKFRLAPWCARGLLNPSMLLVFFPPLDAPWLRCATPWTGPA